MQRVKYEYKRNRKYGGGGLFFASFLSAECNLHCIFGTLICVWYALDTLYWAVILDFS